jgi:hypothetical protein
MLSYVFWLGLITVVVISLVSQHLHRPTEEWPTDNTF